MPNEITAVRGALPDGAAGAESPTDALVSGVHALAQASQILVMSVAQIAQLMQAMQEGGTGAAATAATGTQVNAWEDDPFSEAAPTANPSQAQTVAVPVPAFTAPLLQVTISGPRPAPSRYAPATDGFRYWGTAEALSRTIGFWAPLLPVGTRWSSAGQTLGVKLVAGTDLNAFYSRAVGLRFFEQTVRSVPVYSCASPDVVCHELGHAILDAVRPQLWNAASSEAAAFHESFGDMSAILSALQLAPLRQKVLAETGGKLHASSRLSRMAEQLGWAIRQLAPSAVDADCLRNAANRFFYRRPDQLPPEGPARLLSSEPHSFSRVFTGAFLDALSAMLAVAGGPTDANLLRVSRDMGRLLVDGVRGAPVTGAYFSQVAAAMLQADRARNAGRYRAALGGAFVRRGILSPQAAVGLASAPVPAPQPQRGMFSQPFGLSGGYEHGDEEPLGYDDGEWDDGHLRGFDDVPELPLMDAAPDLLGGVSLLVHGATHEARFSVAPAAPGVGSVEVPDPELAARAFLEDLLRLGRIDLGRAAAALPELEAPTRTKSHELAETDDGLVLKRRHFDCGCCRSRA
ncbi:MAG TPA: hypothetical protein VFE05_16550 [Longimicrobiaceae bacterium]|jgi:hypothetical protein|nr:hypothetical protein [Longimicrobiaceae bacterium]